MRSLLAIFTCLLFLAEQPVWANSSGDSLGTGTAAPSVNDSAKNSQGQNSGGQGAAALAGAMYAAMSAMEFSQCGPFNPGACALGAMFAGMSMLSFMQSGEHGNKADMAAITALDTNAYGTTTPQTLGTDSGSAISSAAAADIAKLKNGIGGNMADFSSGKITTADGKTYSAQDFSSPAAMAAAGFSPDQIAQAMGVSDKVNKKVEEKLKLGAMTAANGYDDGGSGGGGGSTAVSGAGGDGGGAGGSGGLGALARGPAQVAGMSKNFNGEPIGVAGDSIFAMMNRRYQVKEKQNSFIEDADINYQQK